MITARGREWQARGGDDPAALCAGRMPRDPRQRAGPAVIAAACLDYSVAPESALPRAKRPGGWPTWRLKAVLKVLAEP